MRFTTLWTLLICLLTTGSAFAQEMLTERITLQYTTPLQVTVMLKKTRHYDESSAKPKGKKPEKVAIALPDGVLSIIPNAKNNTLSVKGTRAGIDNLKSLISILDVPKHKVTVKVRLVEVMFAADGTKTEKILLQPTLRTSENREKTITVPLPNKRSCVLGVTPRINEDGTLILVTLLSVQWENNSRDSLSRPVRMRPGETKRLAGVTNTEEAKVRSVIGGGNLPERWTGSFVGYYLDATPTVEAASAP